MTTKLNSTKVPFDPPPLNRRIYGGLKACLTGPLKGLVYLLASLKVPAVFAVLVTLFLIVMDDRKTGWFFSTAPGFGWTVATFLAMLVVCAGIGLALKLLGWLWFSLFR